MTFEDKTRKTLAELGIADEAAVRSLFAEAQPFLDALYEESGIAHSPVTARAKAAKDLRDRVAARHGSLVASINENWLKKAPKPLKPVVGQQFNVFKKLLDEFVIRIGYRETPDAVEGSLGQPAPSEEPRLVRQGSKADLTLPGYERELGSVHPVTRVQRELEDIFIGLGFHIETGPEIESVYNNFDALNIPESHPSRDDWDTLYIDSETLLRTHTSPVQIRAMRKHGAPLYIVTPGKCYRNENPDATHSAMFHQMEGLAVDTDITFADLKGTLDFFAKKFFGEKTRTRFQPSFFPFTEPSGEMAASCPFCGGQGCRTCKESGWIELMGCGMVHPDVLRHGGIDPDRYSGWAFGLGIDRFAMLKYDIGEIQSFFQSDVRFLRQF